MNQELNMKAKITKVLPDVILPEYHTSESAGFDIAAGEGAVIQPGQIVKVRTGLIIESPVGHFLMIVSRGSTASNKGLKMANAVGIVDRDYAGPEDEIFLPMHNFTNEPVTVQKGERIAQGMFMPVDQVSWVELEDNLRSKSRGSYGSTGGYSETQK